MESTERTRCLFYVGDVLQRLAQNGEVEGQVIKLNAAYDSNPDSPNHAFWKATPSGNMELTINNPAVFGFFRRGKQYWLDISPVD